MIFYLVTERFASTIRKFIRGAGAQLSGTIRYLTYEELFFERSAPLGHYIFTDFDRLNRYELENAAVFAAAVSRHAADARILNHPMVVLERTPLLVKLHEEGINDFTAVRLDTGEVPKRYPVFLRAEDGCTGPETEPIADEASFHAAIAKLRARNIPLKGRVAIGIAAEKASDGLYRKYGAFNVGGTIIPQHLMRSDFWVVKKSVFDENAVERFGVDLTEQAAAEDLAFVKGNPHEQVLRRVFALGGIDFGRVDYGVIGGKVQIYEINTNPTFPRFQVSDNRSERRALVNRGIVEALRRIDTPIAAKGPVRYDEVRPRASTLHLPRFRLPASLARRFLHLGR